MKKLLFSVTHKDFEIQTFRCGGKGGQNVNKRETGVRIIHKESGIAEECREEREQLQNRKRAFEKLCNNKDFKESARLIILSYGKQKCREARDV